MNAHGPVTLEGGVSKDLTYTIRLSVNARTEAEARRALQQYAVRVATQGAWTVLTAPGGVGDDRRHHQGAAPDGAPRFPRPKARWRRRASKACWMWIRAPGMYRWTAIPAIRKLITGGGDIQVGRSAARCAAPRARAKSR